MMLIVGSRPKIVRLTRVMARLDVSAGIGHAVVHSGQNHNRQLKVLFFDDLGLRAPDG